MGHVAADQLERAYRAPLLDFCSRYLSDRHEAEEVVQEVLMAAIAEENEVQDFRAWLYRAARNRCISRLRERARRTGAALPPASEVPDSIRRPISYLVAEERTSRLADAVDRLPETYREVVELRYIEGLHRAEIATLLELDLSTVKWRLSEALRRLRQLSDFGESSIG